MPIRHDDPRPPFQQLADDLRAAIAAGELAAGQRLPSTRDLAEQYGIAPMTAQSAIRVLRDEGLVVSQQGRGTFVHDAARGRAHEKLRDEQGEVNAIAAELRSIHATLQGLDDRVSQLERRVTGPELESGDQAHRSDE